MIIENTLAAALLSVLTVVAIPAPTGNPSGISISSTDPNEAAYPSPTYAFHETIYRTQAKALVGIVMPVLSVLAIIPLGLIFLKRRQEKRLGPNWESRAPQSYQKAYWSSRYQNLKMELDATQEIIEMAGAREAAEMENGDARCEVGEGEGVELAAEESRAELGDGDNRVGRDRGDDGKEQKEKSKTWREGAMGKLGGWRWSWQEPI